MYADCTVWSIFFSSAINFHSEDWSQIFKLKAIKVKITLVGLLHTKAILSQLQNHIQLLAVAQFF